MFSVLVIKDNPDLYNLKVVVNLFQPVLSCQNGCSEGDLSLQIQDVRLSFICSEHCFMDENRLGILPFAVHQFVVSKFYRNSSVNTFYNPVLNALKEMLRGIECNICGYCKESWFVFYQIYF